MRAGIFRAVLGFALVTTGCVPSLHPLFTEKTLIFDPALLGNWGNEDQGDKWSFIRSGENGYAVEYTQEGEARKFEAHLVQLGKFRFLDLLPGDLEAKNELYKVHFIPAHTGSRVWIEGDVLRIALMDDTWLKSVLSAKPGSVAHENLGDLIVLTAPTPKLQEFFSKFAEDEGAFPNRGEWRRLK